MLFLFVKKKKKKIECCKIQDRGTALINPQRPGGLDKALPVGSPEWM